MSFTRQNISNYYLYDTTVENLFVSEYMPSAPGDYVKLYLAALMCLQAGRPIELPELGTKLGMSRAQIDDGFAYWEAQGLVRRSFSKEDKSQYDVDFVNLREQFFGLRSSSSPAAGRLKLVDLDDGELRGLYARIENVTGRLLENNEPEEIASWLAQYSMDPDVIVLCYKYCTEKKSSNRCKYVGTVLKDWKAKGLHSTEDVEEHLADLDKHYNLYRQVFRLLGFHRSPSEAEKRIMDGWFDVYGFTMDKVAEACGKTTGITNPNINYVNSVLKGWYEEAHDGKKAEKDLFNIVERSYREDRENNEKKTNEMRQKVFTRIPRIKDILNEQRENSMRLSRAVLSGGGKALEEERKKAAALMAEKKTLLVSAGFDENAMDAVYTCKRCKDTGRLDDGKRCSCYDAKLRLAKMKVRA